MFKISQTGTNRSVAYKYVLIFATTKMTTNIRNKNQIVMLICFHLMNGKNKAERVKMSMVKMQIKITSNFKTLK